MTTGRVWQLAVLATLFWTGNVVAEELRARIVPVREALLSADMAGRITAFPVQEGAAFRKGDLLISFDCNEQQARLSAAEGGRQAAEKVLEARRKLAALGSATDLDLALAEADVARARGEVQVMRSLVAKCELRAPFDGRMVRRRVNPAESATIGQPLAEILDDRQLELEILVPSRWIATLKRGDAASFIIDETGRQYKASITMIGARIDPVSQSVPVRAEIAGNRDGLVAGMSGVVVLGGQKP